jgi:Zn finger protein HypA/HybF involved in hydrogenase expression
MSRKKRRAAKRKAAKMMMDPDHSEKLSEKIFQFNNLPENCLTCVKPFDKNSLEMVQTWNVVVAKSDTVRLYCPECWSAAKTIIEDFKDRISNQEKP